MEDDQLEEEIWSEYFRIKNTLMDYYQNYIDALGTAHMLIKKGERHESKRVKEQLSRCQREAGKILHWGIISKAFKEIDSKDRERIKTISRGQWTSIKDFEFCEEKFDQWFENSRFFDINIKKERVRAPHEY